MDEDTRLIAVSVESIARQPYILPNGSLAQSAVIRGESENQDLNFSTQTGLLNSAQLECCNALDKMGSIVVEAPENWRFGYYNSPGGWHEAVIQLAMSKVASMATSAETRAGGGYDPEVASAILEITSKSFPQPLSSAELKYNLQPQPTDTEFKNALDALLIDGYINAPHIRVGAFGRLHILGRIGITAEGRRLLKRSRSPETEPGNTVVQGNQINNFGQIGALGDHAHGEVNLYSSAETINGVDLHALANELDLVIAELRKSASSRVDDRQIMLIGNAAESAEKGDRKGVISFLSKVGKGALLTAKEIGTDVAAKTLAELIKTP